MKKNILLLCRLVKMDFRKRYLGTLLGGAWAFFSPLFTILLIYFVMTFGLKAGYMDDMPFINWLIPGMLAWFYVQETISSGVTAVIENAHFVTKIRFPLSLLPLVKVLTPLLIHAVLMGILMIYLAVTSQASFFWVQLLYYLFCAAFLCLGIGYLTAATMVFVHDTAHLAGVLLQLLFWATPIFWNPSMLHGSRLHLLVYSPFNYIISGYRGSLFGKAWFWEQPVHLMIFWLSALTLLSLSFFIYCRAQKHFADVL